MTDLPGEFDDSEEERTELTLPPEDRFWRHPSELDPVQLDPAAVRRRWLLSHPSRRSVLTAGIVGALLASGVAALATHLADTLAGSNKPVVDTALGTTLAPVSRNPLVSTSLAAGIARVSAAMATVETTRDGSSSKALGVIIRSNGTLLVPSSEVAGAQSAVVTLADGDVYVGYVVGSDDQTGLSVVRINGASGLATIAFSAAPLPNRSLVLAVTSAGGRIYSLGTMRSTAATVEVAGHKLIGAAATDLSISSGPLGSPLLSSTGSVEGIITGWQGGDAVVTPAWLASTVASDLMIQGSVAHGWLGIHCQTNVGKPSGVRVTWIAKGSELATNGLKPGGIIVAVDQTPVTTVTALKARLYGLPPGSRVVLRVDQAGKMTSLAVSLSASPAH